MDAPDAELVIRAQAGEADAFAQLIARYREVILRRVRALARGDDNAQDLAQETFIAAFEHLAELREPEKFGPWLHRIALNAARQWWRREGQISFEPLWEDETFALPRGGPAADAAAPRLREIVQDALAALPPEPRSVVLLHYFDGYDYGETAALLDVPVSTVRGRLHLARRRLRKEMAELAPQKGKVTPLQPTAEEFPLTTKDLAALRGAEMLASKDESRPVLQTICIEPDGTLVSTDIHRLYIYRGSSIRPQSRVLVCRSLFSGLWHRHDVHDAVVSFAGAEATLRFVDDRDAPPERVHRAPLLLEGQFPRYDRVIPTEASFTTFLSVRDLRMALDEVARFESFLTSVAMPDGEREGRKVTLTFSPHAGLVLVQDGAVRSEPMPARWSMHAEIPAAWSGLAASAEFTIALNRTYLRECLQALAVTPDDRIEMRLTDPLHPIRIQPEATEDRFTLVMPMHLYLSGPHPTPQP